jgi:hypothetical protein
MEFFPLFTNFTGALLSNCFIGNPPENPPVLTKLAEFKSGP